MASTTRARVPDPLQHMIESHKQVSEWLHNLEQSALLRGDQGQTVVLEDIRMYFQRNVRDHFAFEETVLFPALLTLTSDPGVSELIRTLRKDHIDILTGASRTFRELALLRSLKGSFDTAAARALTSPLVEKILAHAMLEDEQLLPHVQVHRDQLLREMEGWHGFEDGPAEQ